MLLLLFSIVIALLMIVLGMLIMGGAGRHVNMDRLQVFIAVATGFMMAVLFIDLLPENLVTFPSGPRAFFAWSLLGMVIVIAFERYGVPRLRFVEHFFHPDEEALSHIETHDEQVHDDGTHGMHGHSHDHHDHHDLKEAAHCDHSHEHAHLHRHTHLEVLGTGEVCSAIACFMICSFFDGIALSSVQAVDRKLGVLMVIGVVLHLLPEGVLSGAMALAGGASLRSAKKVLLFIGGSFVLGSLIPYFITGFENTFLAISSGILIFVTLVQLLPTALKLRFAPAWIALGGLIYVGSHVLMEMLGVHFS
ncbi:MAG: ZIP family metal transporter [Bdellovibrionales bacterium]|nr:ZIP family metal transporter [Bdellovibrionales bacterium]